MNAPPETEHLDKMTEAIGRASALMGAMLQLDGDEGGKPWLEAMLTEQIAVADTLLSERARQLSGCAFQPRTMETGR